MHCEPPTMIGMNSWIYIWFLVKGIKNAGSTLLNVGQYLFLIATQFIKHFYYIKHDRS